jgi:hypothetical protein
VPFFFSAYPPHPNIVGPTLDLKTKQDSMITSALPK